VISDEAPRRVIAVSNSPTCGSPNRRPWRALRIYFSWDDDAQQVVVGWLPSHLRNRMS
jgi:hypothetical protein